MRIGCLQFAPQVGDVDNNLNRADSVLHRANPQDLDILVLPELAFSGYNFKSLQHISPYLEPTASGITSLWARTTALKYNCIVTAGYPEKVDVSHKWPASPEYYNSAITVNADGETIANYRKSFLYCVDETWALEGDGFFEGEFEGLGNVAMGICMDLNPYKFQAPWNEWEFAHHILYSEANLVILSMAWLTREDARTYSRHPKRPDMETLSYWLARLEPVIRAETEGEIIVVIANRCGTEGEAVYAGTSAVLGIHDGEVKVYGILGCGEKELLVVDTNTTPHVKIVSDTSPITAKLNEQSEIPSPKPPQDIKSFYKSASTGSETANPSISQQGIAKMRPKSRLSRGSVRNTDGIIDSPPSPVSLRSPTQFSAPPKPRTPHFPREDLRSHFEKKPPSVSKLNSPNFRRSFSPRFGSRMQQHRGREDSVSPLVVLATEPNPIILPATPPIDRLSSPRPRNTSRTGSKEHDPETFYRNFVQKLNSIAISHSPAFHRPTSPKSRNTSGQGYREPEESEGSLLDLDKGRSDSPFYFRPPSPKSRTASRVRRREAQVPYFSYADFAEESQRNSREILLENGPQSASAVLDQPNRALYSQSLGSRGSHTPSRPKSAEW